MGEIVVGVDQSEHSKRAVLFAASEAKERGLGVLVAHVIPWSPFSFNTPQENEHRHQQREEEIKAATEQIIEPALAELTEHGVTSEAVVRHGDPVDVLIELITERGGSHIVMGRSGDSRVRRAVFGSYPAQLVQEAPVPVTVVP